MNVNNCLDWTEEREANETIRYNHTLADSPIGQFSIEWKGWKKYDAKAIYLDGCYIDSASTLEGAKELVDKYLLNKAEQIIDLFRLHKEEEYTSQYRWQPLRTAPKDGSIFLLLIGDYIELCRWDEVLGQWIHGGIVELVEDECYWMPITLDP